jgi:hypothetical protein
MIAHDGCQENPENFERAIRTGKRIVVTCSDFDLRAIQESPTLRVFIERVSSSPERL